MPDNFYTAFMKAVYAATEDLWNFQLISPPRNLMVAVSETVGVVLFDLRVGPHPTVIFGYIADVPETSRSSYLNGAMGIHGDDVFWYAVGGALDTRSDIPSDKASPPVLWRAGDYDSAFFDPLPEEASQLSGWLTTRSIVMVEGHDWGRPTH